MKKYIISILTLLTLFSSTVSAQATAAVATNRGFGRYSVDDCRYSTCITRQCPISSFYGGLVRRKTF